MTGLFFSGPLCLIEGGEIKGALQRFWVLGVLICHLCCMFLIALKICKWEEDLTCCLCASVLVLCSQAAGFSLHGPETTGKLVLPSTILSGC